MNKYLFARYFEEQEMSRSGPHIKLPVMCLHRSMENSRDSVPAYVSEWRLSTLTQLNGPPEYAIVRY